MCKDRYEGAQMSVIQVYAPTMDAKEEEIEDFYIMLQNTIDTEQCYYKVVMGDWNAKVGKMKTGNAIVGQHGLGRMNKNGELLVEFAYKNNLKVAGTFYEKRNEKKWTWISPNREVKNEIDHFLTSDLTIVKDISVISKFEFPSDHRICRASIKVPKRAKFKKYMKTSKTGKYIIPVHKLEEAEKFIKENLNVKLRSEIDGSKNMDVQELYDVITDTCKMTVQKYGSYKKEPNTDDKLTKETKILIEKREKLRELKIMNRNQKIELAEIRKLARREMRKDCKKYEEVLTKEIIEETWSTRKLRKELNKGTKLITELIDDKGKIITGRDKIIKETTRFYEKLYEDKKENQNKESKHMCEIMKYIKQHEKSTEPVPKIIKSEIKNIIKSLKIEKASGPDFMENEFIKLFLDELLSPLEILFNKTLEKEKMPKQWYEAEIIILHKKGDKRKIENYRPLSLSADTRKIFMKILKNRIYDQLDWQQPEEQAGFRRGYSTIDHIHALNQLVERANEYNIETHIVFIDFRKAFDSVKHDHLLKALIDQGTNPKIVSIIKNVYENATAHIKLDKIGETFKIEKGVAQGDPLSSNLFNATLEWAFRKLNWEKYGINIDGKRLNNLRFADDIVLVGQSREEIQKMVEELTTVSNQVGLQLNIAKTKYMSNIPNENIKLGEMEIEIVEEYTYLGRIISFQNGLNKELQTRKKKAWRGYWALKQVFKGNMKIASKTKILNSCVIPILTYGSQTWSATKAQARSLQVTQRSMERSLLGIKRKDRIKNIKIRKMTGARDVLETIGLLKIRYAGHLARMTRDTWAKRITEWTPYGNKRRVGRPSTRWRQDIEKKLGISWRRVAKNRSLWKKVGETYAREWASGNYD